MIKSDIESVKTALKGAVDFANEATECGAGADVNDFELKLELLVENTAGTAVLTVTLQIKAENSIPF